MIKYLNYESDFPKQYSIGIEQLNNASIPIKLLPDGECMYIEDCILKEYDTSLNKYNTMHLNKGHKIFIPERCLYDTPKFEIPIEFKNSIKLTKKTMPLYTAELMDSIWDNNMQYTIVVITKWEAAKEKSQKTYFFTPDMQYLQKNVKNEEWCKYIYENYSDNEKFKIERK